jgi:glutamate synthase (NADPH/NADH) small chain
MVVLALGFDAEDYRTLFAAPELAAVRSGALRVKPFGRGYTLDEGAGMTSLAGVFAAGDIVRGASLVVRALKDGLDAADQMHAWLEAEAARVARTAAE